MAKFNFLMRDWKEQLDIKRLNEVLTSINEPVRALDIETNADYYCLVIHTPDLGLSSDEWITIFNGDRMANEEIPDHAPKDAAYLEASVDELRDYIRKVKESEVA